MVTSIELQVISKILTCDDDNILDKLLSFDSSYYSVFKPHIKFIFDHVDKYKYPPDIFTFQTEFPDITLVDVKESLEYLSDEMNKNKQHILLVETFNNIKDLGNKDIKQAWEYISSQYDKVCKLDNSEPMDIIHQAPERAGMVKEYSNQSRIPTGFPEIDKLMYGGFSTVEELVIVFARTNTGKSWVCTKMMESAHRSGFPVLYYSPEMQASFLATRFDTWRGQFKNSDLHQGNYSEDYIQYIQNLSDDPIPAFILEDKDAQDGVVNCKVLSNIIKRHGIKLLIVDGLSYMEDLKRSDTDYIKYKNICLDLFRLSKTYGCAVVVAMQANRETKNNTSTEDGKDPWPNLYNLEGSDHPARIATQAFALRQVYDRHILDIRLEKARNSLNQKPVVSYSWDPNTGNMNAISDDDSTEPTSYEMSKPQITFQNTNVDRYDNLSVEQDDEDDGIQF